MTFRHLSHREPSRLTFQGRGDENAPFLMDYLASAMRQRRMPAGQTAIPGVQRNAPQVSRCGPPKGVGGVFGGKLGGGRAVKVPQ